MRSRKLPGLPVLTIDRGVEVGRIQRPLIDAEKRQVFALIVSKKRSFSKHILPVSSVHAFGNHAVTVQSEEALRPLRTPGDLAPLMKPKQVTLLGAAVITIKGDWVGTARDFNMDGDGKIITVYVTDGLWKSLSGQEATIAGDMIVALGYDALIVSEQALQIAEKERIKHETRSKREPEQTVEPPTA